MTWIKICGTTSLDDARLAVYAGADALGFIFAPSPRRVEPRRAREIICELPPEIEKVGVFVNESVDRIGEIVKTAGLTAVQLHGDEDAKFARRIRSRRTHRAMRIIRALPMTDVLQPGEGDALGWDPLSAGVIDRSLTPGSGSIDAILLDSGSVKQRGGTGKTLPWDRVSLWVGMMRSFTRVILAGGLNPENIAEALQWSRPWGVDVVSGVERKPGKKDPAKLRAFVQAVRQIDRDYSRL